MKTEEAHRCEPGHSGSPSSLSLIITLKQRTNSQAVGKSYGTEEENKNERRSSSGTLRGKTAHRHAVPDVRLGRLGLRS
jgi:hypothetical protein